MDDTVSLPAMHDDLTVGLTLHHPETGEILDVNSRLEQLYGYTAEELRQMTVEEYTAPSTKHTQQRAVRRIRAAGAGEPQSFEWQIKRSNGESRWVSVDLNRTTVAGETYVLAEITEITEYKAREGLLRLLNRVIRHNLRNDMNVLLGYADRIKTAIENDQLEQEVETIADIASEVGELSDSLDEIENIVDSDATQRTPINLKSTAKNCARDIHAEYPEVDLTFNASEDIHVIGDKGLQYAIDHAIENAVEHNDRETPELMIEVADNPENEVGVVRIIDNGPSIPAVEIDVLNDETKTSSTYHGSGVGLWVMKWCVSSLGGELSFEDRSPRGNIVRISIPKPADRSH